mgnify:CR=1 FL=1
MGFGTSLSFSGDGSTLAIASNQWYYPNNNNTFDDRIAIIHYVDGEWVLKGEPIFFPNYANYTTTQFGKDLELSYDGDVLVAGIPYTGDFVNNRFDCFSSLICYWR